MTVGVGGSDAQTELTKLSNMALAAPNISLEDFQARINNAIEIMEKNNIDAMYLNAGTNLYYFTGTQWYPSERLVGAIVTKKGELAYISPYFEVDTLTQFMTVKGKVHGWHEHESPYQLVANLLTTLGVVNGTLAIDESTPFFISNGLKQACPYLTQIDAKIVTAGCRAQKSAKEISILQTAKNMTLEVQKSAAKILREGISVQEVQKFIDDAHKKVGALKGSYFCIVLFGKDTSFPHGVKNPKNLAEGDVVLIDTGCQVGGYNSDITRTYVYGDATAKQREMWQIEKNAQLTAFEAAQIGVECGKVDDAARAYIAESGLGPDYQTPGCPHRTGHGIGLDIHEWPYLVRSDATPLATGMCFSNEPMLVIPDEFGIRLEDHFYMAEHGPVWFTEPSFSIDDPFGYNQK